MAQSDIGTKLYRETATPNTFELFLNITSAPASGAAPSQIEVTELQQLAKSYVLDRPDTPLFEFGYNYTEANYTLAVNEVDGVTAKKYLLVYPDGSGYRFSGIGATWVNEITPGSAITAGIAFAVQTIQWLDSDDMPTP
jgi:hypothetical protein